MAWGRPAWENAGGPWLASFYLQTLPERWLDPWSGPGCSLFPSTVSKPIVHQAPFSVGGSQQPWGSWCRVVSHCSQSRERGVWAGRGAPHGVSILDKTEDRAASVVGVCQAGEAREHLHLSPVADHRSLGLLSSLCFQVWPTELLTMMWMPCVTYVSSSTTCPSVARTQLRSASAMTQGRWRQACPSLAFWHLYADRISGPLGAVCRVCQQGPSCGEVAGIWGWEQSSLVISSLPWFWLWEWKRLLGMEVG